MRFNGHHRSKTDGSGNDALFRIVTESARDRLELAKLELEDEKQKYVGLLVWIAFALIGGTHAVLLTSLVAIYFSPAEARPWVAAGLLVLNWALVAWSIKRAKSTFKETAHPFEHTVEQLRKDWECITRE